jgi:hypothetical protein
MYPSSAASSYDDGAAALSAAPVDVTDRILLLHQHAAVIDRLRTDTVQLLGHIPEQTLLGYWRAVLKEHPKAQEPERFEMTEARLRDTFQWRKSLQLDERMADAGWRQAELDHRRLLRCDFIGNDLAGRPVLVECCGAWDIPAVVEAAEASPKTFETLHCMSFELMKSLSRPPGCRDPYGHLVVMDLRGLSTLQLVRYSRALARAFIRLARVDGAHYPDSLAHVFIVNAGITFSTIMDKLVRPFLPGETLSKLHVSSGVPRSLAETIAPDVLPTELGGAREQVFPYDRAAPLTSPSRPTQHERREGLMHEAVQWSAGTQ